MIKNLAWAGNVCAGVCPVRVGVCKEKQQTRKAMTQIQCQGRPLAGSRFVVTGVFPEHAQFDPPGTLPVKVGKVHVRALIEMHGGKVTDGVSRKTTHVVVGDEPGVRKLNDALKVGAKLKNINGLRAMIRRAPSPDDLKVEAFSKGMGQNGIASYMKDAHVQRLKSEIIFSTKRRRTHSLENVNKRRADAINAACAERDAQFV